MTPEKSVFSGKITKTFLRTDETMERYVKKTQERKKLKKPEDPFANNEKNAIKKFKYWLIIENEFPYDGIATENHLLFTRRKIPFKWEALSKEERKELEFLKATYFAEHYDAVWENLPKGQTVPGHFHLQLLTLKRESID